MAGNLILIETQTPSAVANIDFTSIAKSKRVQVELILELIRV